MPVRCGALVLAGCGGGGTSTPADSGVDAQVDGQVVDGAVDAAMDAAPDAVFPEDFADDYFEMRDCRHSHEHELRFIRVLASPTAQASYAALSEEVPYPVGATLVKLEYDDGECTTLLGYTAMRKQEQGTRPEGNDWMWQRLTTEREVIEWGAPRRCIDCHTVHCPPPFGYDLTCAEEL